MTGTEAGAATDAASVKAAQADAAEASLNQRLIHTNTMSLDPKRPRDYNLKILGPHHHHHTLVNKKVKNANGENDMTVLVRGDNVFGTTVSKSFPRVNDKGDQVDGIDTVSISIASYRVVEVSVLSSFAYVRFILRVVSTLDTLSCSNTHLSTIRPSHAIDDNLSRKSTASTRNIW
jgi:hypothetical protein